MTIERYDAELKSHFSAYANYQNIAAIVTDINKFCAFLRILLLDANFSVFHKILVCLHDVNI